MTFTEAQLAALGDPRLAELSRADDTEAFAELWRRHAAAGAMAARQFASIADPQDIVSEAYLRIFRALRDGGGPREAFRPYLYRTIRNIALDWRSRHPSISLEETADLVEPGESIDVTVLENVVTAQAFEGLPERWRAVLWYLEVEGMSPSEVGPLLGLSPNATSVLAGRAHEGFKRAWLQAHVNDRSVPSECQWTNERMSRYVRHSLTRRSRARFDRHLDDCERCALLVQEIDDLGGQLATVLLPITLGATAGSLLLGQLRDHTANAIAATIAPLAVPSAATVLSGAAAAILIASGALLGPTLSEPPAPPVAVEGELPPGDSSPPPANSDQPASVTAPPPSAEAPVEPIVATPPAATEPAPTQTTPAPAPTAVSAPPVLDLSVSLLSGTVELDAVIDVNPSTGLGIQIVPGLSLLGW